MFSSFYIGRRYKKYPPPEQNQGWDTKYSTVPPWLPLAKPLIDALTGAPDRPFPTDGSEVVSHRGTSRAFHQPAPLWAVHPGGMSSSMPFVWSEFSIIPLKCQSPWRKFLQFWREQGNHNSSENTRNAGYIIRRIM